LFNRFNILTILKPTKYSIGGIREQEKDMLVKRLRPPPIRMGIGGASVQSSIFWVGFSPLA